VTDVKVTNNAEESRYEAWVDGEVAGYSEYELDEGRIVFTHTVVRDEYEGQGVGSTLARRALDDVRADGARRVVPRCPFIRSWIEKHPDYQDLVHPPR
jgi:predicted GNAT family acetyltransferase